MDEAVMDFVVEHRNPGLDRVGWFLADLGGSSLAAVAVILATVLASARGRRWAWGAAVSLAAVASVALASLAKGLVDRPRPPSRLAIVHATGSAMPSSVALLCAAMGTAALLSWERPHPGPRRAAAAGVALVVALFGVAVVYLGAHWTTDVLVGWVLGALVGVAAVPAGRVAAARLRGVAPGLFAMAERYAGPRE